MTVIDVIKFKYPDIQRVSYWQLQYDGTPWENELDGLKWENEEIVCPTQEEFDAWRVEYVAWAQEEQRKQIIVEANDVILQQLQEIDLKSIRALRTSDTKRLADYEIQAAALRTQLTVE
jgi:hypothetical protein